MLVLEFERGSIAGYVTDDKYPKSGKKTEHKILRLTPQNWSSYFFTITKPQANIYPNMTSEEKLKLEERVVEILKTVYDPEIPVDIYNLGLIYRIELHDDGTLDVDMTLTAPNCPAADFIVEDVRIKLDGITGIKEAHVNLVFEPEWDKDMMSEEAKLELGFM